jgi:serine/threonine protein kinase
VTLERKQVVVALPAYEVGEELGRGAFGIVLAARHRHLHRPVAIKQLPRAFAEDPQVRARFATEARLLAALDHPHIVPIYDYVERSGLCLLVMERLTGGTVATRFREEGMTAEEACAVVLATCAALHHAHLKGVLHRDIKPDNLMFSAEGVLKVTDFGIAKMLGGAATMATRAGYVLGTPAYIAPEQAEGGELSPATDVYATATVLYELLSGRLPYSEEGGPAAVLYRHVHQDPRPLADAAPRLPRAVVDVAERALARDLVVRYGTAEEFGVALARAATASWGPGWPLSRAGMPLRTAGPITAATTMERPGRPIAPAAAFPLEVPAAAADVSSTVAAPAAPPSPVAPWERLLRGEVSSARSTGDTRRSLRNNRTADADTPPTTSGSPKPG